jgi:carboxyl-terminal processing protease
MVRGVVRSRRLSRATHVAAFAAGAVIATALGVGAIPRDEVRPAAARYRTLDSFAQALAYVSNNYVDEADEQKLLHDATRGMVAGLDQHSVFLSPRRYQRLRQDTEGEFGQVGITLGPGTTDDRDAKSRPWPFVDDVVAGSPADLAGIQIDDRVVEINGVATADPGKERKEAGAWEAVLRGPSGTRVRVTISRLGWNQPRELSLVRAQVKVPSVEQLAYAKGLGYVAVSRFQEATASDVTAALTSLKKTGHLSGLILDLRGNPGGLLDQAVSVADLFLESGGIVTIRGRQGSVEDHVAHKPGTWSGFPMVVLVDAGSASAAEILAGALQDQKRATLVGLQTYGKGSVQTFFDLDDGSGLKLTTARYFTPSGKSLEGKGITPDKLVDAFAGEDITVGSGGAAAAGGGAGADDASLPGGTTSNDARIRDRLHDDPQFAAALVILRRAVDPGPRAR